MNNQQRHGRGRPGGGQWVATTAPEPTGSPTLSDTAVDEAYRTTDRNAHARHLASADDAIRANAAANKLTTIDQARSLAGDRSSQVRWELANHENPDIALLVTGDSDPVVRYTAIERLASEIPDGDAEVRRIAASVAG